VTTLPDKQTGEIARQSIVGLLYFAIQSILTKAIGVAGQIVLAILLPVADVGLVGLARTIVGVAGQVANPGVNKVLIQRRNSLNSIVNPAIWIAATCSIATALIAWAASPLAAYIYAEPQLTYLIAILAIGLPFTVCATVPQSVLQVELKFKILAIIAMISAVGLLVFQVALANAGFGALSLVVPSAIIPALAFVALLLITRPSIKPRPEFSKWRQLYGDSKWVFIGMVFMAFISQGDYFILGVITDTHEVGLYFFAFNLSTQTITLLTANLGSVLHTALARFQHNQKQQVELFLKTAKLLAFVGIPLCFLQAAVARPAIEWVFPSRWHDAIPILQILSLGMSVRVISTTSGNLLFAQNRFQTFAVLAAIYFAAFLIMGFAGAIVGGAIGVATSVAIFSAVIGFTSITVATRAKGKAWSNLANIYLRPMISSTLAVGLGFGAMKFLASTHAHYAYQISTCVIISLCGYLLLSRIFMPELLREITNKIKLAATRRHLN